MVVSADEFEKEVRTINNEIKEYSKVIDIKRGRPEGSKDIPIEVKKDIATEYHTTDKTALQISHETGLPYRNVRNYIVGTDCGGERYQEGNKELKEHIVELKKGLSEDARNRLKIALNEITPERIAGAKIRDVSAIARDMAAIARDMEEGSKAPMFNNQVVIYRPQVKDEDEFETITVNE